MINDGAQLIFSELFERHGRIRVPLIQRDYAQGRIDQAEVRDEFLAALKGALLLPPEAEELPLNLDFIYGSVEGENPSSFQPLDGQQRLTTLFLLHWYLAWRDECSEAFRDLCADGAISKFSYQVRPSSKEFFDALVVFTPSQTPDQVDQVSSLLQDQPWYFRRWRLDPTIQSTLVMLDAIHARFRSEFGLYARLINTEQPAITFQLLDLRNFGLSDDLYIKMNSRGKPLTPFETFKARYEQILRELFPDETLLIDGQFVSVSDYFARRMDTRWADFFWPHRDTERHVFDVAVMNVFRAVILITRSPERDGFVKDIIDLRSGWKKNSYHFFQQRDWLDVSFSKTLLTLLDAWSGGTEGFVPQLPDSRYFKEESILKKILFEPTSLGYDEIIQLAAYTQFLKTHVNEPDPTAFQEWMRVVFNLSVNTEYNRPADLQRSLSALIILTPHMISILEHLADPKTDISAFNRQQVAEEKLKARLLLADEGWRSLVDRAEAHGYFRGQIEFLLDFCGAGGKWRSTKVVDWEIDVHVSLQEQFENYLKKAEMMFNTRGLVNLEAFRWERALLSIGNYLLPSSGRNISFLVNSSTDQASWKRLLRGTGAGGSNSRVLLRQLWGRMTDDISLNEQLDSIIDSAAGLEPWRQAFVETPEALEYCGQRAIRWNSAMEVYLLKRAQMNGRHAELFTFCLFHDLLRGLAKEGRLAPLVLGDYQSVNVTDYQPHILFAYEHEGHSLAFKVEFEASHFITSIVRDLIDDLPDIYSLLCDSLGFQEKGGYIVKESHQLEIKNSLLELAQALTATTSQDSDHA